MMSFPQHNIPRHVAIIMDGNGRWAQSHGKPRSAGHLEGVSTVKKIVETAAQTGIRYLTLYTFSTENWNRPESEVNALMNLIVKAVDKEKDELVRNNVRLRMIGDKSRVPDHALTALDNCMEATNDCDGIDLILALSYSSRWEITNACREIAAKVATGELSPSDIDVNDVNENLSTAGIPDPDLLIRTGGDFRISNFLLWQIAYSEIIVTPTFWPDYTQEEFLEDISEYQRRQRRFGLTAEQL